MRISDWSSDVALPIFFGKMVCIVLGPEMMDVWRICSGQGQPPRCPACRQQYPVGPDAVTILQGYGTSCQVQAIGRASCRARVRQYVYVSVVAVSLKHNKLDVSPIPYNRYIKQH